MKSTLAASFYVPGQAPGTVVATGGTAGPWSPSAQHGGPPSGLLARAIEAAVDGDLVVARVGVDLLGPVPVGELAVGTSVLRPGRTVSLVEATLRDVAADRTCAVARAWLVPRSASGPGVDEPLAHAPADGIEAELPHSWSDGYVDHVEWRWVEGSVLTPGRALVWMRSRVPLLPREPLVGVPLLMTLVDSASGVSAALDPAEWSFMNTEVTVHVLREPVGDWLCVDATTTLGPGSVGVATATVHDQKGLVARSAQALLVGRRPAP